MLSHQPSKPPLYFVTADYPPESNAGTERARALVKELAVHCEVKVISTKRARATNGELITNLPIENFQNTKGLIKRTCSELIFSFLVLLKLIFAPQNSILIITSPPFFLLLIYILLPLKRGQLRVLDVRDIYPDVFVEAKLVRRGSLLFKVLAAIEVKAYKKSDLIFTVCYSLAEKITQRAQCTNVHLVLNGYGKSFDLNSMRKEEVTVDRPFTVTCHGNFGRFQDVEFLNRLVKETAHLPLRYLFVGFGARFDQVQQGPNVEIRSAVPNQNVPAILAETDLGLSVRTSDPVGRNAIPVKVLEYLGMGIPSLVFPVMPDLDVLAQTGAIKQFESHQLEEVIEFLTKLSRKGQGFKSMKHAVQQVRYGYSRQHWVEVAAEILIKAYKERDRI